MHEQEMASHFISNAPLPQGFSVYQPALGAQLQFFPALGSRELDELLNAFIPGPASMREKRASVSLDFLEYAQLTGRNFKFYTISPASAATSISSLVSTGSPFNISPSKPISTWQFPGGPGTVPVSPSSSSSTQTPKSSKANGSPSHGRPATDFSHLPGMKIMTKDGLDVTNSASRGSKTKEQRDHAHLMRIIKACDNCRRKKIRCDPSHKKRPSFQAQSPKSLTKPAKRARTAIQKSPAADIPATDLNAFTMTQSSFPFEPTFTFAGLQSLDPLVAEADPLDPWDQFVQYPPLDADSDDQLFVDLKHYVSSRSPSSSSQTSDSPVKSLTPLSDRGSSLALGAYSGVSEGTENSLHLPSLDSMSSFADYTDFNLFSPGSLSFLEDELTIPVSRHRQLVPAQSHSHSLNGNDPGSGLGSPAGILSGIDETSGRAIRSSGDMIPGAPPGVSSSFQSSPDLIGGDHSVIRALVKSPVSVAPFQARLTRVQPFANASENNKSGRFAPESSCEGAIIAPTAVIWGDSELSPAEDARQSFLSPQGIGARSPWNAAISPTRNGSHVTNDFGSRGTSDHSSTQCSTKAGDSSRDPAQVRDVGRRMCFQNANSCTQTPTRQATAVFCLTPASRLPEIEQRRGSPTASRPGGTTDGNAAALAGETSIISICATRSATSRGQEKFLCGTRTSSSRPTEVSTSLQHAQYKLPAFAMGKTLRSSEGSTGDCLKPNGPQAAPLLATALIIVVLGGFARIPLLQFVAAVSLAGAIAHACISHKVVSDQGCELSLTVATSRTLIMRLTEGRPEPKDGVSFTGGFQKVSLSRALTVVMV